MNMKWKVRHKTEGWTGTLEITNIDPYSSSSHRQAFHAELELIQNAHKPSGEYVEDPWIHSISELEIVEERK